MSREPIVAVVGLGYVGLPLAAALAATGSRVVGVETDPAVRAAVRAGNVLRFEPGVAELVASLPAGRFTVEAEPPPDPAAVVLCVGTHVDEQRRPDVRDLESAARTVAEVAGEDTVVVVRSTVAIGTCRRAVLPLLRRRRSAPLLAFCPERTIQGRALAELARLPQIIGGLDERSVMRASELLKPVTGEHVLVSSLEAAEAVKLICNAHTDLIYGFGNEVALIAHGLGLDAAELIRSANAGYPRPDLSRPGFVGGSCLVKDPYLLLGSGLAGGYRPVMVEAARAVNERVPHHIVDVVEAAVTARRPLAEAKVFVAGIAYKGDPPTDDVRGSAAEPVARRLAGRVAALAGHDQLVPPERISALGYRPVELDEGLDGADALVVLTNHPAYRDLTADRLRARLRPGAVVFDAWGVTPGAAEGVEGLRYLGLGRG